MAVQDVDADNPEDHEVVKEIKQRHPEIQVRPVLGKKANKRIEFSGIPYHQFLSEEIKGELRIIAKEEALKIQQEERKKQKKQLDIDHLHLQEQTDAICKRILLDVVISEVMGASWRDEVAVRNARIINWFSNTTDLKLAELHLRQTDLPQFLSGAASSLRSELNEAIHRSKDDAEPRLRAWLRARSLSPESLFGRMFFSVYRYNPEPRPNNDDDASDPAVEAVGVGDAGVGDCGAGAVAAIAEDFDDDDLARFYECFEQL